MKEVIVRHKILSQPECKDCKTKYAWFETAWRSQCQCEEPNTSIDGWRGRTVYTPKPDKIGTVLHEKCKCCGEIMGEGSVAHFYEAFPGAYGSIGHPACVKRYNAELELHEQQVTSDLQNASSNAHIEIWHLPEDSMTHYPSRGIARKTFDGFESFKRAIPSYLPPLPEAVVIQDLLRRPYGIIAVLFLNSGEAEAWWKLAIATPNASCELNWFESGNKEASHQWTGDRFGSARSAARIQELEAELHSRRMSITPP